MAIYSLHTLPASRGNGKNAIAMAAYRSGGRLIDERTGQICDYTRKQGIIETALIFPHGVEFDRQELWNMAEQAEKRKDARIAREIRIALPHELDENVRIKLAREFAEQLIKKYQIAVDLSLHKPDRQGDNRNYHAHLLLTTRQITPDGLRDKSDLEKSDKALKQAGKLNGKEQITEIRENWEKLCNLALERHGLEARISSKSYKAREIEKEPTIHLGPAVTAMERKGIETEKGTWNRIVEKNNLMRSLQKEIGRLERICERFKARMAEIKRQIILEIKLAVQPEIQSISPPETLTGAMDHERQPLLEEAQSQEVKPLSLGEALRQQEEQKKEREESRRLSLQEEFELRSQGREKEVTRDQKGIER